MAMTAAAAGQLQPMSPGANAEPPEASPEQALLLLGVGDPSSYSSSPLVGGTQAHQPQHNAAATSIANSPSGPIPIGRPRSGSYDAFLVSLAGNKSQSSGGALDALAALAGSVTTDDDGGGDSANMPPPPPRAMKGVGGRLRSASNPEGMEKWDSLGGNRNDSGGGQRRHFVLPSSILEEELAGANAACAAESSANAMSDASSSGGSGSSPSSWRGLPLKKRMQQQHHWQETNQDQDPTDSFGTSPNSVMMAIEEEPSSEEAQHALPEEDESDLEPAELLRRARARLLEDLSTEGAMGEKGVLPLPHSLSKYKEVYNKNGRIGIYTPAERAAIIAKFNTKRSRRVWNKKIRYNCRKNLADRRMRVKGRFVKRSTEQAAALKAQLEQQAESATATKLSGGRGDQGPGSARPKWTTDTPRRRAAHRRRGPRRRTPPSRRRRTSRRG